MTLSPELYAALALFLRYVFSLLGVLMVLFAFLWLWSSRAERRRRLRQLPLSGLIGELVVLEGDGSLRPGDAIPVPWEGILGSVRSCDICVPGDGIRRRHLSFSFSPEKGLLIQPFHGCRAQVGDTLITSRARPEASPLRHGAFLRLGDTLLRLRLFAGLDPAAGFEAPAAPSPLPAQPAPVFFRQEENPCPPQPAAPLPPSGAIPGRFPGPEYQPGAVLSPAAPAGLAEVPQEYFPASGRQAFPDGRMNSVPGNPSTMPYPAGPAEVPQGYFPTSGRQEFPDGGMNSVPGVPRSMPDTDFPGDPAGEAITPDPEAMASCPEARGPRRRRRSVRWEADWSD